MQLSESWESTNQKLIACRETLENLAFFYPQQKETLEQVSEVLTTVSDREAIIITMACCEILGDQIKSHISWDESIDEDRDDVPDHLHNSHINPFENAYGRWWTWLHGIPIMYPRQMLERISPRDIDRMNRRWFQKDVFGTFVYLKPIVANSDETYYNKPINSVHEWKEVDIGGFLVHDLPYKGGGLPHANKYGIQHIVSFPPVKDLSQIFTEKPSKDCYALGESFLTEPNFNESSVYRGELDMPMLVPINDTVGILFQPPRRVVRLVETPTLHKVLELCLSAGISFPIDISQSWVFWKLTESSKSPLDKESVLSIEIRRKLFPIFQRWSAYHPPKNTAEKRERRLYHRMLQQLEQTHNLDEIQEKTRCRFTQLFMQPWRVSESLFTKSGLAANNIATAFSVLCLEKEGESLPQVGNHDFYYENQDMWGFVSDTGVVRRFSVALWNYYDGEIFCTCIKNDETEIQETLRTRKERGIKDPKFLIIDITKNPIVPLDEIFQYCDSQGIRIITTSSLTKFQKGGTKHFYGIMNCYGFSEDELDLCRQLIESNEASASLNSLIHLPRLNKSDITKGQETVAKQKAILMQELLYIPNMGDCSVENSGDTRTIFSPERGK